MTSGRQCEPEHEDQDEDGDEGRGKQRPFWVPPPEHLPAFIAFQRERARKERSKELALPVHKKVQYRFRFKYFFSTLNFGKISNRKNINYF